MVIITSNDNDITNNSTHNKLELSGTRRKALNILTEIKQANLETN